MEPSRRSLVVATLVAAALLLSAADGAAIKRRRREIGGVGWADLPACTNRGSICAFRIFGVALDGENDFFPTCRCPQFTQCKNDYFNLATQVINLRCLQ